MRVSPRQVYLALRAQGIPVGDAIYLTAIAGVESRYETTALNTDATTKDYSVGLFQINYFGGLYQERAPHIGTPQQLQAENVQGQAAAAAWLYRQSGNTLAPWQPDITSGKVNPFLPAARQAAAQGGGKPSVYQNPFRQAKVTPARIDQGVDYAGKAGDPIYALGPGIVDQVFATGSGWPGGGWVSYRLTAGPSAGQRVFIAEDVAPAVSVGQKVDSSTVVGRFSGLGGIETGWAAPASQGDLALAWVRNESNRNGDPGLYSTLAGVQFSNLLASTGAPPGQLTPGGIRGPGGKITSAFVATKPGQGGGTGGGGVTTTSATPQPGCLVSFPTNPLQAIGVSSVTGCLFRKSQARALIGGGMLVVVAMPVTFVGVAVLAAAGFKRTGALTRAANVAAIVPGGGAVAEGLHEASRGTAGRGAQVARERRSGRAKARRAGERRAAASGREVERQRKAAVKREGG